MSASDLAIYKLYESVLSPESAKISRNDRHETCRQFRWSRWGV